MMVFNFGNRYPRSARISTGVVSGIQQEVANAKGWILHCRQNSIEGCSLAHYKRIVAEKAFNDPSNRSLSRGSARWIDLVNPEMHLPPSCRGISPLKEQFPRARRYDHILYALYQCRKLKATDAKDKVYGVLGLVQDYNDGDIVVDYGLPIAQVYRNVAELVLRKYKTLDFLLQVSLGKYHTEYGLPTWLPDWNFSTRGLPIISSQGLPTRYSEMMIEETRTPSITATLPFISNSGKVLNVHGFRIDNIAKTYNAPIWNGQAMQTGEYLNDWDEIIQAAANICSNS